MKKTTAKLADGRELLYFDAGDAADRDSTDLRPLEPVAGLSEIRRDPATGDWVTIAAHRQGRTYHPSADECPLCPSRDGRRSEIPAADYQVAVFENRFPSLSADAARHVTGHPHPFAAAGPGAGRCEVVCFTADHGLSFADLDEPHARLVLDAWTDRTADLSARPGIEQVYCFENRGAEIGVTLAHPHGQIYALPFTAPRTVRMAEQARRHRADTGRNLFEDLLAAERTGERVVLAGEHWTAFVPFAARWPYEIHLYPHRRVLDLTALEEAERAEFPGLYLELLRRFDRLFIEPGHNEQAAPTPYISAWHQAPSSAGGGELAMHLELFTIRRTVGKLKFLAGVESGMDAFVNDVSPEAAAQRLREVAS
ncbi:galactose-1-phosphate uridylyltransferase [Kitasatospora sp. NPDC059571]|uniref:galactose-1-phosphate uridylyltransferase n=1 Tax=Kitasatospora sp. NPDC059571 TaxID=3346871 RepID=UPI0036970A2F